MGDTGLLWFLSIKQIRPMLLHRVIHQRIISWRCRLHIRGVSVLLLVVSRVVTCSQKSGCAQNREKHFNRLHLSKFCLR